MKNAQLVNGITVKFYHGGEWIEIDTDSTLPKEIGTRTRNDNDNNQWVGLVEKAYAKLYDNYANLTIGLILIDNNILLIYNYLCIIIYIMLLYILLYILYIYMYCNIY